MQPVEDPSIVAHKRTAFLIANPKAGSYNQQHIKETIAYLQKHGWEIELKLTTQAGDAGKIALEATKQKRDVVIAVGGDGTINEIIQGLAGSETALGVLPNGTVNVWAREVGIPLDTKGAQEILVGGQERRVDLGQVNERYFLLMATLGFDAEVAHAVERGPIKRLGVVGYLLLGSWLGLGYPNFTVTLHMGKEVIRTRVVQIVFGNTQLYAGAIRLTWRARCDDGLLDMSVINSQNIFGRVRVVIDFLLRHKSRQRWIRYETAEEVQLYTKNPTAIQVDGDPLGHTSTDPNNPTIFRIVPGALKVIVPQILPPELFTVS